jgi:hypothetical protein
MSDLISRKVVTGEKAMVAHVFLKKGAEALETLVRDAGGPEGLYVNLAILELLRDVSCGGGAL